MLPTEVYLTDIMTILHGKEIHKFTFADSSG